MTLVTRVNGSSRDPYPPTTVSLLTKPRFDFRSASTTRIGHLNLTNSKNKWTKRQTTEGGPRGDRGENAVVAGSRSKELLSTPIGDSIGVVPSAKFVRAAGASF